jgi:hypothetical protein
MSSHRVGPTYDGLRVTIQPYPGHVNYSVMRVNHNGPTTRQGRIASGSLTLTPEDMAVVSWVGMLERVLDKARAGRQAPPPPPGDTGGQLTLNLDLST